MFPFAGRPAHTDVATHSRFALETALLSSRQKHVQCEKARDLAAENSLAGAQPCNRHAAPTFDSIMRKHPMCKPHTARRWSSHQSQICRHATDAETGVFNKQPHRIAARLNRKRPPQTYEVRKKTGTKESGTSHRTTKSTGWESVLCLPSRVPVLVCAPKCPGALHAGFQRSKIHLSMLDDAVCTLRALCLD